MSTAEFQLRIAAAVLTVERDPRKSDQDVMLFRNAKGLMSRDRRANLLMLGYIRRYLPASEYRALRKGWIIPPRGPVP